jgi:hypothetical protein
MIGPFSPVELAVSATATGSAAVGLYVGYQAFRGLRRHRSRPMWYLSAGLVVLTAVTYSLAFVGTLLFQFRLLELPQQDYVRLAFRLSQLVGLLLIAYSLTIRE